MRRGGNMVAAEACGPVTRAAPAALAIGGVVRQELAGLIFPPEYPTGIETDALGQWRDGIGRPLVPLTSIEVEVGNDCPGQLVLVRGHVQARELVGPVGPYDSFGPNRAQWSMAPLVKLAVSSHGNAGWTVIDSDSEVVMPGGTMTVVVLVPYDWFLLGSWPDTESVEIEYSQISLRISACPCDCGYSPEGVLTWWQPFAGDDPVLQADRVHARPRRGWGLEVSAQGDPTVSCYATLRPDGTQPISRVAVAPGALVRWERWGAPYLAVDANQDVVVHGRWGIK